MQRKLEAFQAIAFLGEVDWGRKGLAQNTIKFSLYFQMPVNNQGGHFSENKRLKYNSKNSTFRILL